MRDEMIDRFGRLPDPTRILFDLISIRQIAVKIGLQQLTVRQSEMVMIYRDGLYPTRDRIASVTKDPGLDIEFPHGESFKVIVRLSGASEAEQVHMAKNLLQKLL